MNDDELRARYVPAELLRLEIYPEVWDRKPECCAGLGARWEAVMSALRAQCVRSCGPFCLG